MQALVGSRDNECTVEIVTVTAIGTGVAAVDSAVAAAQTVAAIAIAIAIAYATDWWSSMACCVSVFDVRTSTTGNGWINM